MADKYSNLLNKLRSNLIFKLSSASLFMGLFILIAIFFKLFLVQFEIYDNLIGRSVFIVVFILMMYLGYSFYVKKVEKRETTEYSKNHLFKELSIGISIGAILISLQVFILWLLGIYSVSSIILSNGIIEILLLSIITGFAEELINKGIIFRILEEKLGTWIALIIVALEVGITHISNDGASIFSTLAVSLEFGIMLVLIYILTRRLWVVTGFHFAWNFMLGGIFGLNISGVEATGLLVSNLDGPKYLTGGIFGIEVGVIAILFTFTITILLLLYIIKKKLYKKPAWF